MSDWICLKCKHRYEMGCRLYCRISKSCLSKMPPRESCNNFEEGNPELETVECCYNCKHSIGFDYDCELSCEILGYDVDCDNKCKKYEKEDD